MDLFQDDEGPSTSSSSSAPSFSVNKAYANKFEHNKARAELQRLDEKYSGKGADDEDSSSDDETEDEEGEQITPEVDAAILRTIARIRAKDTAIYQDGRKVFDDERALASSSSLRPKSSSSKPPSRKEKKMNLASYQRSRMEELIKTSSDPAKAFADATSFSAGNEFGYGSNQDQGYGNRNDDEGGEELVAPAQEQEKLKREVRDAFNNFNNDDDDEDEDGGFFVKRDLDQEALEGDDYRKYLLSVLEESGGGEKAVREALKSQIEEAERGDDGLRRKVRVGEDENLGDDTAATDDENRDESEKKKKEKKEKKKGKEKIKEKSKEEKDEDFLMNYILNRGWMDDSAPSGPSKPSLKSLKSKRNAAKQSTSDSDSDSSPEDLAPSTSGKGAYGRDWEAEAAELESEASFDSKAEAFETAYNFRYEQMESGETGSNIASFARDPKGSVRRKDEKRKLERENKKERKEKAKKEKLGELNRYAELKRKDILERVKKLREATGSQAIGFEDLDLDADFDPDAHDRAMNGAFNDEYYQEGEEGDFAGEGDYDENVKYDADGKPIWDDDIDIGDILEEDEEEEEEPSSKKSKKGKGKKKSNDYDEEEDGPIEMDADFVDGTFNSNGKSEKEMSKKEKKKLKKKLKAAEEKKAKTLARNQDEDEAVNEDEMDADKLEMKMKLNLPKRESKEEDEPRTEEERRSRLESLKEEYDALDYEDVVGDQPTRFKYTKVPSSSYGLTPVEILLADDSQLNSLIGLKNLQPYKKGGNKRPADMGARLREFRSGLSKNSSFKKNAEEMEKRGWKVEGVNAPNSKDGKKKKRAGKSEREKRKREQAEEGEGEKVEVENGVKVDGEVKESKEEKEKRKKEKKEKKERKEKNGDESGEPKKKKSKKE